jgi:hypothetical protein
MGPGLTGALSSLSPELKNDPLSRRYVVTLQGGRPISPLLCRVKSNPQES